MDFGIFFNKILMSFLYWLITKGAYFIGGLAVGLFSKTLWFFVEQFLNKEKVICNIEEMACYSGYSLIMGALDLKYDPIIVRLEVDLHNNGERAVALKEGKLKIKNKIYTPIRIDRINVGNGWFSFGDPYKQAPESKHLYLDRPELSPHNRPITTNVCFKIPKSDIEPLGHHLCCEFIIYDVNNHKQYSKQIKIPFVVNA